MNKSFFDFVKTNFFRPLSGIHKEVNYQLLKLLNEKMQESMEYVDRSDVLDIIIDYFKYHPGVDMYDDETEECETDIKKLAAAKVAYFEKTGWLSTERGNNFKVAYQMEPAAIEILTAMERVENRELKPVEYSGFVNTIYTLLKNFDITQSTATIEQLARASQELNNSLRSINKTIKAYLDDLLSDDSLTMKEILDKILNSYQNNVVGKAFYNLRVVYNPANHKNDVIKLIDTLLYEKMGQMIENYLSVKALDKSDCKVLNDAQQYIVETLTAIREQFENIDTVVNILNDRNTKYITTATSRIKYLMDEGVDFEGKINAILKIIDKSTFGDEDTLEFRLREYGKIDDNSLYSYSRRGGRVKSQIAAVKPTIDQAELENEKLRLKRQIEFSLKSIDDYIGKLLEGNTSIEAKDVKINSDTELLKLFYAQMYAGSEYVHFDVEFKEDFLVYGNKRMSNYVIYRR